jgi:hypothetical protein
VRIRCAPVAPRAALLQRGTLWQRGTLLQRSIQRAPRSMHRNAPHARWPHTTVRTHSNTGVRAHTPTADALSRVLQAEF